MGYRWPMNACEKKVVPVGSFSSFAFQTSKNPPAAFGNASCFSIWDENGSWLEVIPFLLQLS